VAFGLAYSVSDKLLLPFAGLINEKLVFISPTEAFFVNLKISFFTALSASVPVILYQAWAFVAPGLLSGEKKQGLRLIVSSTLFFIIGASFCFFIVLPLGLKFLIGYGGDLLTPMLSIGAFIGFCIKLMFVFGLVFQLPLIVIFLHSLDLVTIEQLKNFRGYLIVSSFVISAVITPPDIFTQVLLALPLMILYETSLIFIRVFRKKEKKKDEETTDSGE
jgi:sec-independent protein translocase protein TatC